MAKKTQAISYLRTSTAINLDGDSETRQKIAIEQYAKLNNYEIVEEAFK